MQGRTRQRKKEEEKKRNYVNNSFCFYQQQRQHQICQFFVLCLPLSLERWFVFTRIASDKPNDDRREKRRKKHTHTYVRVYIY